MVCIVRPIQKWPARCSLPLLVTGILCVFLHYWLMRDVLVLIGNMSEMVSNVKQHHDVLKSLSINNTKFILMWNEYYLIIQNEHNVFAKLKCLVSNCVFTRNKKLLGGDYSNFDAIIFSDEYLNVENERPTRRKDSQLYIFTSIESPSSQPACELYNDHFYNWTFTYRLDSDVVWNYFVVRDVYGDIVAPSASVQWDSDTLPISQKIKNIFKGRQYAAIWIVSHCGADSLRDEYLTRLQEHLFHYSLQIDVYGKCTNRSCGGHDQCEEKVRSQYYFYMAFENSIAVDYVTEKILHGYDNYVIPIVYGGANYSRFLPPGSYINAREYDPYNLAGVMYEAINDPKIYESYFRWTNLYTIDSDPKIYHPLCDLCEALHSKKAKHAPAKEKFRFWWNTMNGMKWCLSPEFWNETSRVNIDGSHVYGNHN